MFWWIKEVCVWLAYFFVSGVVLLVIFALMAFVLKVMETIAAMPLLW